MSTNPALVSPGGEPRAYDRETFVMASTNVSFHIESGGGYPGQGGTYYGKGTMYLSAQRAVFVNSDINSNFRSFNIPLHAVSREKLSKPMFGSPKVTGIVVNQANGGLAGPGTFKLSFKNGASEAESYFTHMKGFLEQTRSLPPAQRDRIAHQHQMEREQEMRGSGPPPVSASPNIPNSYYQNQGALIQPPQEQSPPQQQPPTQPAPAAPRVQHAYVDPDNPDVLYIETKTEVSTDLSGPNPGAGQAMTRPPPSQSQQQYYPQQYPPQYQQQQQQQQQQGYGYAPQTYPYGQQGQQQNSQQYGRPAPNGRNPYQQQPYYGNQSNNGNNSNR